MMAAEIMDIRGYLLVWIQLISFWLLFDLFVKHLMQSDKVVLAKFIKNTKNASILSRFNLQKRGKSVIFCFIAHKEMFAFTRIKTNMAFEVSVISSKLFRELCHAKQTNGWTNTKCNCIQSINGIFQIILIYSTILNWLQWFCYFYASVAKIYPKRNTELFYSNKIKTPNTKENGILNNSSRC